MDTDLPLLDRDRIARAADGMISNYGKDALAEAQRRAQKLRSAGCDSSASSWEAICKVIQGRLGGCADGRKRPRCRMCGSIDLEIPENMTPDSIVICLHCGAGEKHRDFNLRVPSGLRQAWD